MPSSASTRLRLEKQFTGENVNAWGTKLNDVIDRLEEAITGLVTVALTDSTSLTSTNYAQDQARFAAIKFTGTGPYTVTIPSVQKMYLIWNAMTYAVTLTTGAGTTTVVDPDDIVFVMCDATNVKPQGYDGLSLKDYIASVVVGGGAVVPSVSGNSGKYLTNDGSNTLWRGGTAVLSDIGGVSSSAPVFTGGATLTGNIKQNYAAISSTDIDVSSAQFFTKSISTSTAFTFSGTTASYAYGFVVKLVISSGAVPSWPAAVMWAGGSEPSPGNGTHLFGFLTFDGGTTWVGVLGPTLLS